MASWTEMVNKIGSFGNDATAINSYINQTLDSSLDNISKNRNGRNVIFYASSFLQKPQLDPMALQITNEEINGLMAVMHGMDFSKGLSLILHTPGGVTNATETIVEYYT
jgi:ClpP class serine protease